jgi:hypothetical protein
MTPNAYLRDLAIWHLTEEDRREAEELERREMKAQLAGLDKQVRTLRGDLVVSVKTMLLHAGKMPKEKAEEFVQRELEQPNEICRPCPEPRQKRTEHADSKRATRAPLCCFNPSRGREGRPSNNNQLTNRDRI